MKDEGKTYVLPRRGQGFVNDLDGGLTFLAGRTNRRLSLYDPYTDRNAYERRTNRLA